MFLLHIFARIKSILLVILAIFRRALCCFSRHRKRSYSECEILSSVNVVQNNNNSGTQQNSARHRNDVDRDWNSWDDSPRTVDEHIEQYRHRLVQSKVAAAAEEPSVDFFQDMAPKVIKQKKVLIDSGESNGLADHFTRLQATSAAHIPHVQSAELEDWSDDNDESAAGWDELNDETTKAMIREKRKELRSLRQQKQQQQRLLQAHMQSGSGKQM